MRERETLGGVETPTLAVLTYEDKLSKNKVTGGYLHMYYQGMPDKMSWISYYVPMYVCMNVHHLLKAGQDYVLKGRQGGWLGTS